MREIYINKDSLMNKSEQYNSNKLIGMLLVVLAHSGNMYTDWGVISPLNKSKALSHITKFIYSFHMKLYMVTSGMVYGFCIVDMGKYKNTTAFIIKKARRLLVPYLFWGWCLVAPVLVYFRFIQESFFEYCFKGILLMGNSRHLWFLIALFEIFVFCATFRKCIEKISPMIICPISLIINYIQSKIFIPFHLNNSLQYLFYFYLGFLYNKLYDKIIHVIKHILSIFSFAFIQIYLHPYEGWFLNHIKAITGCLTFLGLTSHITEYILQKKIFNLMNSNGFAIYLMHPMIIYILYYFLGAKDINPWLLCFGIMIIAYLVPMPIAGLIRKMKMKFVLGE